MHTNFHIHRNSLNECVKRYDHSLKRLYYFCWCLHSLSWQLYTCSEHTWTNTMDSTTKWFWLQALSDLTQMVHESNVPKKQNVSALIRDKGALSFWLYRLSSGLCNNISHILKYIPPPKRPSYHSHPTLHLALNGIEVFFSVDLIFNIFYMQLLKVSPVNRDKKMHSSLTFMFLFFPEAT